MNKYGSRKFIVTMSCVIASVFLAYYGKMSSDVALVLSAGMAAYNWANAKTSGND